MMKKRRTFIDPVLDMVYNEKGMGGRGEDPGAPGERLCIRE